MKCNKWTLALIGAGIVSLPAVTSAEEKPVFTSTAVAGTTLSGYVNTAVHFNPGPQNYNTSGYSYGTETGLITVGGPGLASASPIAHKDNGFNLNVVDLTISKAVDEGQWGAGYKAEVWMGPDANTLNNNSLGVNVSDFGVKNAYVELNAPIGTGLDLKLGVWDTIIGYEVGNAGDNPNYTRSYGYTVEPTQHTGLLGSYKVNDVVSVSGGIANTWDSTINGRVQDSGTGPTKGQQTYMGAFTLTAPESMGFLKGGTLTAGAIDGRITGSTGIPNNATTPPQTYDRTSLYVGASIPTPMKELSLGACWDEVLVGEGHHDTTVIGGYASFKATEKMTVNLRGEYAYWGDTVDASGFAQGNKTLEVTTTLDYSFRKELISRIEFRWDHDLKGDGVMGGGPSGGTPLDNEYLLALNLIYKF
jgi:hypothetical protein